MATRPLPATGSIFLDSRGGDRALRVSWHDDSGMVVLSFRLTVDEVPELIAMLRAGLDRAYATVYAERTGLGPPGPGHTRYGERPPASAAPA